MGKKLVDAQCILNMVVDQGLIKQKNGVDYSLTRKGKEAHKSTKEG